MWTYLDRPIKQGIFLVKTTKSTWTVPGHFYVYVDRLLRGYRGRERTLVGGGGGWGVAEWARWNLPVALRSICH